MEQKLIRVSEAARALSLSTTTTYELIAAGTIPHIRLGRSIRIHADDLEAKLAELRKTSTPAAA